MTYRVPVSDLKDLTAAKTRPNMLGVLRSWGIVFRIDADGWPVVDPEHLRETLGNRKQKKATHPRFE